MTWPEDLLDSFLRCALGLQSLSLTEPLEDGTHESRAQGVHILRKQGCTVAILPEGILFLSHPPAPVLMNSDLLSILLPLRSMPLKL